MNSLTNPADSRLSKTPDKDTPQEAVAGSPRTPTPVA